MGAIERRHAGALRSFGACPRSGGYAAIPGLRGGLLLAGWLILAGGCVQLKPGIVPPADDMRHAGEAPRAAPAPGGLESATYRNRRYVLHTVRGAEESLAAIARWYTGRADNWKVLARSTPNLRGRALAPGDTVFIPEELIRRQEALPRRFVLQVRSGIPAADTPAAPGTGPPEPDLPPEADDFPVRPFGPRVYPGDPVP